MLVMCDLFQSFLDVAWHIKTPVDFFGMFCGHRMALRTGWLSHFDDHPSIHPASERNFENIMIPTELTLTIHTDKYAANRYGVI